MKNTTPTSTSSTSHNSLDSVAEPPPPGCGELCCAMTRGHSDTKDSVFFESHVNACRSELKALIILSFIVIAYLLMWLPYGMQTLRHLGGDYRPHYTLRKRSLWMVFANSGLNPILYFLMNPIFRREVFQRYMSSKGYPDTPKNSVVKEASLLQRPPHETFASVESGVVVSETML